MLELLREVSVLLDSDQYMLLRLIEKTVEYAEETDVGALRILMFPCLRRLFLLELRILLSILGLSLVLGELLRDAVLCVLLRCRLPRL